MQYHFCPHLLSVSLWLWRLREKLFERLWSKSVFFSVSFFFCLKCTWQGLLPTLDCPNRSNYCQHLNIASSMVFYCQEDNGSACAANICVCAAHSEEKLFQQLWGSCFKVVVQGWRDCPLGHPARTSLSFTLHSRSWRVNSQCLIIVNARTEEVVMIILFLVLWRQKTHCSGNSVD